jgi:choice-of-anchor A domain-containing protein/uncharacterized repeat protein (TIGR01451 family)
MRHTNVRKTAAAVLSGALVGMTGLLIATALPADPAAAATVGPINPVAGNAGFLVVTSGNASVTSNENEGTLAVGGDLTIGGAYQLFLKGEGGTTFAGDTHPTALVVGGRVNLAGSSATGNLSVLSNGYIKIGDLTGVTVRNLDNNNAPVNTRVVPAPGANYDAFPRITMTVQQPIASVGPASPIDFANLFASYQQRSTTLATCSDNLVLTDSVGSPLPEPIPPGTVAFVRLTPGVTNVLNISAADLNNIATLNFPAAPSASTPLLVNVNTTGVGGVFTWTVPNFANVSGSQAEFILMNFPDATQITQTVPSATMEGTIFAPRAQLTDQSAGNNEGNLVLAGLTHGTASNSGGEVHVFPFSTTLACQTSAAAIALTKSVSPGTISAAGTTVKYTFHVENTGNVDLSGITINETAFSGTGGPLSITCLSTTLAPGASQDCTAAYTATQADIDHGSITNTATATGTPATGPPVTSSPSSSTVDVTADLSMSLAKSADPQTVSAAGQTIAYSLDVINTGNQTVHNLAVNETAFSGTGTRPTVSCPVTMLAPGTSTTCTATYTVTQTDINAGTDITDSAVATSAGPAGQPVTSNTATAAVAVGSIASLSLVKSAQPPVVTAVGQTINYSFLVTNTGTQTIDTLTITETAFSGTGTPPVASCPQATLTARQSTTCTAQYTITQADINAGGVADTATAGGLDPAGTPVVSNESSADVALTTTTALSLTKFASPSSVSAPGQVVTLNYVVTNGGGLTLHDVSAADTNFSGTGTPSAVVCPATVLNPGASTTCSATYSVTRADFDAGTPITDSALASGTGPAGQPVTSNTGNASIAIIQAPALSLVASVNPTAVTAAGQTVTYTFLVGNPGNQTVDALAIANTAFTGTGTAPVATCLAPTLAPSGSTTCSATYHITQADIDAGGVTLTATATGTTPAGTPVASPPSTAVVTAGAPVALSLTKFAVPSSVATAGEVESYKFRVTNTGGLTVTGLSVTETSFSGTGAPPVVTCPVTTLAPNAKITCTGTYIVTQVDIDAGTPITDAAVATATAPGGETVTSNPSNATVDIVIAPSLELVKSVDPTVVTAAGQSVSYSFQVTNSGDQTIDNIAIQDDAFSGTGTPPAITCPTATLAPGNTTTCTGTYTMTQADINAGSVTNTAHAEGTNPSGLPTVSPPSSAVVNTTATAQLSLTKFAIPSSVSTAGAVVNYQLVVTNTGGQTINGLVVSDTSFTGTGAPPVIACPVTTLNPSGSTTCTAAYTVTQEDIDADTNISNTAVATGTGTTGQTVTSNQAAGEVEVAIAPSINLVKSVDPATANAAGQAVTYSFLVTNSGDQTLSDIAIDEVDFTGTGTRPVATCATTNLLPGAATTCTATYTITQQDVDTGNVSNIAVARSTNPEGTPVSSPSSGAVVDMTAASSLALTKQATPSTVAAAGQRVFYVLVATNTGEVTLNGITVVDTGFSGTGTRPVISCPSAPLAPGVSTSCSATYVVTQADIDAGTAIVNTATASATTPGGSTVTSAPVGVSVGVDVAPAVDLVKSVTPTTVTAAGQIVTYSFLVNDTGNQTITGVTVTEVSSTRTGALSPITCPTTTLAPSANTTCTATYTVTQADINAGGVSNTAVASALTPQGSQVSSPQSSAEFIVTAAASLSLTKIATPGTVSGPGKVVSYELVVTNSGSVTVTGVTLAETAFSGTGTPPVISCPFAVLAPGQQLSCFATYTVTPADIDAGVPITNTAQATGTDPTGQPVTSNPGTATVNVVSAPALVMVNSATPSTVTGAGQTVGFDFLTTNNGNQTITGLAINPVSFSGTGTLSPITCDLSTLPPSQGTLCHAMYTVTQADIDAGAVTLTATADGLSPAGTAVASEPSTSVVSVQVAPALSLMKTATPDTVDNAGDVIDYQFVVTNSDNFTVNAVAVAETSFSGTGTPPVVVCPAATLAPGGQQTCTASYTVTPEDIAAGRPITDEAVATGIGPNGQPVTSNPATAAVTIATVPGLALSQSVSPARVFTAGQLVTYSFLVTNNGAETVHALSINEVSFTGTGTLSPIVCPVTTLAPSQSTTCTATYTVTQADIVAGSPIVDTARARGLNPAGEPVASPQASATLLVSPPLALALAKSADPGTASAAGQVITFSYAVTNTGILTVHDLSATDTSFSGTGTPPVVTCPVTILAPEASTTCTGSYPVTQADIDAGNPIIDAAVATGTGPEGQPVTSNTATATVATTGVSRLGLAKAGRVIDTNHNGRTDAGDTVHWRLTASNLGTTTLHDITVTDPSAGPATCPTATLAPGRSVTCTVPDHTITAADVAAGKVTDTATATGTNPQGVPVTSGAVTAAVTVSKPTLPVTGADLIGLAVAGGASTAAGLLVLLLTLVRRNRRRLG